MRKMMKNKEIQYKGKDLEAMNNAINYSNWIIDEFKDFFSGEILEVGAGIGNNIKLLSKMDINKITGIEPSINLYEIMKNNIKDSKINLINDKLKPSKYSLINKFNTVVYINVLEHIENDGKELKNAYNC